VTGTPEKASVSFHIKDLVTPLSDNSERIFQECSDNQKAGHGRDIGSERLANSIEKILSLGRELLDLFLYL
jgi:hypothetical protein